MTRQRKFQWFRNTTWSAAIARDFEEKHRSAKDKAQYLRIQAGTLAQSQPEVALQLLERYFESPDDIGQAQAHVDRALALLALERVNEAIASYEAALARELCFPQLLTQARRDLPYLIASRGLEGSYERALELLLRFGSHLSFPIDQFRWNAVRALIAADRGRVEVAATFAGRALDAAARVYPSLQHHPMAVLVRPSYADVVKALEACRSASLRASHSAAKLEEGPGS